MKIDFSKNILDLDGNPAMSQEPPKTPDEKPTLKPIKLKDLALNSLGSVHHDEHGITGEEKATRFALMMRIYATKDGEELELTPEEVTKIKQLVGKMFPPLHVGRAYEILNG